jgi:CHAT domain-containing protein/tetratricopeptide (TPR) repeat protein
VVDYSLQIISEIKLPPLGRTLRSIVLWLRPAITVLAALACVAPGQPTRAQVGPDSPNLIQQGRKQRDAGHYAEAIQSFAQAAREARRANDPHGEAQATVLLSGCQLRLFQYAAALRSAETGAELAARVDDKALAGAADGNASTVYAQLGNFTLAGRKLVRAIAELSGSDRKDLLATAYLALSYLRIRLGEIQTGIASSEACVRIAREINNQEIEARAWDLRGTALLLAHRTADADKSLARAVELYHLSGKAATPPVTLEHLAELKWNQRQNEAALGYIDQAFANADLSFRTVPQYYPLSIRASILRDLGRSDEALSAYRKAVDSANLWRRAALPGDTTNSQTVRQLNDTYQGFAEFAAEQSLLRHNNALAREGLQALAQNRAASLREQLALDLGHNQELPPEYLAKLGELQNVQARVTLAEDAGSEEKLADLENEIGELETKIGIRTRKRTFSAENNPARNSLRDIQSGLGPTEALLSFCLGEQQSYLWAVTGETVNLYRLPAAGEISERAKGLRDALEHRQNFASAARKLSNDLFSQLDAKFWAKPDWLIVGDGALLDRVPFAVMPEKSGDSTALIQRHTIRLLPSELLLLDRAPEAPDGPFLGIADPLYNLADSRRSQKTTLTNTVITRGSNALGRLPGSQREVRTSAQYSGMSQSDLLIGPDANLAALTAALSQRRPAIIHFAVHVVSPPGRPEQAALALSLGKDNIPELLTREKIASLRVPGSLVVLSGCSSGQGQTAPSTGLIGLSRAWLLAGASAVVVSNWPTPDDSGPFFSNFYSQLASYRSSSSFSQFSGAHSDSLAKRAASALQQAQLQIQTRGGYGSSPAFWAAYSIISKE